MADPMGHGGHDPLRVAEAVDRGARLAPVLDLCARCVGLYVDLIAVTAALPVSAVPMRPRSFTLTPDDARRLRPPGWRGWWSAVGSARDTVTRPLAIGITTLGLTGLLLTTAPMLLLGMGGAASSSAAPAEVAKLAASPMPDDRTPAIMGDNIGDQTNRETTNQSDTGPSPTVTLSVGLLVVGSALFVARRLAVHGRPMR